MDQQTFLTKLHRVLDARENMKRELFDEWVAALVQVYTDQFDDEQQRATERQWAIKTLSSELRSRMID